ncbi:MAG: hypothetical protein COW71_11385 [Ignavibacteriales bacterium CG18_big_fil_WC_8_21_14_2_50_31_20]|nr:MAG: hypothetical protein COW71_11385 [Ignavibacteriales bacterium CG18_big_fil_WC_8_21_14_2_50_31_20]
MELYEYISILSTIIWMLIPFLLKKSKHFFFFLFAGLSDAIGLTLWYSLHLSSQIIWIPLFYLMVLGIDKNFFIRKIKLILTGLIPILIINYYSTTYFQYLFTFVANIIITTIFARYFYWVFIKNSKVSLFYLLMTIYGLFLVYKSILIVVNINLGLNAYYATTLVQIFIGLFLIFVRKDYQFSLKD